jgi:hypothetical protein
MMPKDDPVHVPPCLLGEADPDTLAGLVRSSHRLGLHWPLLPADDQTGAERAHPGFRVPAGAADLIARMSDYGG